MVKQYTVELAYADNDKVTIYVDGKSNGYRIMSYWETVGYCNRLEEDGFTRAYDLDKLHRNLMSAKEKYEYAKRIYDEAKPYALIKEVK